MNHRRIESIFPISGYLLVIVASVTYFQVTKHIKCKHKKLNLYANLLKASGYVVPDRIAEHIQNY